MLNAKLVAMAAVALILGPGSSMRLLLLDGRTGKPITNQRVLLFAGDAPTPLGLRRTNVALTTDKGGQTLVEVGSPTIARWVQVWADGYAICQRVPNQTAFNVEKIASSGVVASNDCGSASQLPNPGWLVVYFRRESFLERMKH